MGAIERTSEASAGSAGGIAAGLRPWLRPAVATTLLGLTLWVLHREMQAIHYHDVQQALAALPPGRIVLALLIVALNYLVLTGYDQLAFRYIGKRLPRWRIARTAFVSYAVSHSVGFNLLSGTAVRHRFYTRWGIDAADLSRIVVFNGATYWLGLLMLGGWSLVFHSPTFSLATPALAGAQGLGVVLMAAVAAYLLLASVHHKPLRVRGFEMRMPTLSLAAGQLALSMVDWTLAVGVVYTLLPADGPSFAVLLAAFLSAQVLGLASHVPGGLGVFEGTMALLLGSYLPVDRLIASLLLYRLLYYILPLMLALMVLLVDELHQRRLLLARLGTSLGSVSVQLAPRVLSVFTFLAGVLLLVSGATPAEHDRLEWMADFLPVGLFAVSHFAGSIVGVGLLLLAQAVSRRLRVAYYLVIGTLLAGVAASLLKAADWEEALLLSLLLLVFIPARALFDRRAALLDTRFSRAWILSIAAAVATSVWLGIFVFRHVEYSNALWWEIAVDRDAPRFLRASLGAAVALLAFSGWRLLRPMPPVLLLPSEEDLSDAGRIIATQPQTLPFLVYLRDKALLFNDARNAFLMYGVRGRTWVALGDPVGPPAMSLPLIRAFVDRADDDGGIPVFYQVQPTHLHHYADLGMSFAKLGEEARVPLEGFSLSGHQGRELRFARNRLSREQIHFRIVEPDKLGAVLPQIKAVSDDWLKRKSVGEKGFSLGFFDTAYLSRMPVALLEREGRVLAFANLLCGPAGEELSVDLMRFAEDAPPGTMDGLFVHLMQWGKDHGYRWFNLGMAPLSGLQLSPVSPPWVHLGRFVYRYGENFYNFEGLRAYKEKFRPVWEPRYLAYPGGLSLPIVLTDIAALSAGGYGRIFRRRRP